MVTGSRVPSAQLKDRERRRYHLAHSSTGHGRTVCPASRSRSVPAPTGREPQNGVVRSPQASGPSEITSARRRIGRSEPSSVPGFVRGERVDAEDERDHRCSPRRASTRGPMTPAGAREPVHEECVSHRGLHERYGDAGSPVPAENRARPTSSCDRSRRGEGASDGAAGTPREGRTSCSWEGGQVGWKHSGPGWMG